METSILPKDDLENSTHFNIQTSFTNYWKLNIVNFCMYKEEND